MMRWRGLVLQLRRLLGCPIWTHSCSMPQITTCKAGPCDPPKMAWVTPLIIFFFLQQVKKIRSHTNMESARKQLIMDLSDCGIEPSKISWVFNHGGRCMDKVTSHDCRNHLAKASKNNIGQ